MSSLTESSNQLNTIDIPFLLLINIIIINYLQTYNLVSPNIRVAMVGSTLILSSLQVLATCTVK